MKIRLFHDCPKYAKDLKSEPRLIKVQRRTKLSCDWVLLIPGKASRTGAVYGESYDLFLEWIDKNWHYEQFYGGGSPWDYHVPDADLSLLILRYA